MKTLISSLIAISFAVIGFAQPFTLAVDGFRSTEDPTKNYIVVQVPDADKATLFQKAKNYFTVTYDLPRDVLSESGVDVLTATSEASIPLVNSTGGFLYKLACEFKDGRVKMTPKWIRMSHEGGRIIPLRAKEGEVVGVYTASGELFAKIYKIQIEPIINGLASGLEKALKETNAPASEDW